MLLYLYRFKAKKMSSLHILFLIIAYFGVLIFIAQRTGKKGSNSVFFTADKSSPWYVVAFGMVGATLSGVTFISVPGWVEASQFSYMQMVMGYVLGYFIIGAVLLPLYYRLQLVSIYTYLEERFGPRSYTTGAVFFLISRIVGASFRLYLVANILQLLVFDALHIPFWFTVVITILLIWVYTFRSGIKTIVWTDTLQTFFMLSAMGICIYALMEGLEWDMGTLWEALKERPETRIFFFDDIKSGQYFWKQFFSGAFIAIVMTGLDQDMMQKNLSCINVKDAQKNMFWFTVVLVIVKFIFLTLGFLLLVYAKQNGIDAHKDALFPTVVMLPEMGIYVGGLFILGLIAAAYSSADSALTSLTTSVAVDLYKMETHTNKAEDILLRKKIHLVLSGVLVLVILVFKYLIADASVVAKIFTFAGFTYGPLLGLYAYGLLTQWKIKDRWVAVVAFIAPVASYICSVGLSHFFSFELGFFILVLNGALTFLGLVLIRAQKH